MNVSDKALEWLKQGHSVIPIKPGTKEAAGAWRYWQTHLPSENQVRRWFAHGPYHAYGVILGRFGLTVLDFDSVDLYTSWLNWARSANVTSQVIAEFGYSVITGKGVHVYVQCLEDVQTRRWEGFDLQSVGAYVLGEGSTHPSGAIYTALPGDKLILPVEHIADVLPPDLREKKPLAASRPSPILAPPSTFRASKKAETSSDPLDVALTGRELLELAKWAVPIWELLGIPRDAIRDTGRDKGITCCPLHHDEHPSLSVDFETNRVSCLAGCTGARGWSTIDVWMWRTGERDLMRAAHQLTGR